MKNLILTLSALAAILLIVLGVKSFLDDSETTTPTAQEETVAAKPLEASGEPSATPTPTPGATSGKQEEVKTKAPNKQSGKMHGLLTAAKDVDADQPERGIRAWQRVFEAWAAMKDPWQDYGQEIANAKDRLASHVDRLLYDRFGDWKSAKYTVVGGDSLVKIRKKHAVNAGYKAVTVGMIKKANGMSSDVIRVGDELRIPQGNFKVVIDKDAYAMRVYFADYIIGFYRIGIGRQEQRTPVGEWTLGAKQNNPTWFAPGKAPVPHGDPENPLGPRWITLEGKYRGYGVHGTNDDAAVGSSISQGCIRMYNNDVLEFADIVPVGTPVTIR